MAVEQKSELINVKKPLITRNKVSLNKTSIILGRERQIKDAKTKYEEKGTTRFINEGAEERLSAIPFDLNNLEAYRKTKGIKVVTEGDIKSYYYGYYIRSVEKLVTIIKHPEIRPNIDIEAIGYNDSQDKNINIELLPQEIKTCKEYLLGYKKGLEDKTKTR